MRPNPQQSPETFAADVVPVLVERWRRRCFCGSPGFLKVLSFDFRDYGNVPAQLVDSAMLWGAIVGKHLDRSSNLRPARPARSKRRWRIGPDVLPPPKA